EERAPGGRGPRRAPQEPGRRGRPPARAKLRGGRGALDGATRAVPRRAAHLPRARSGGEPLGTGGVRREPAGRATQQGARALPTGDTLLDARHRPLGRAARTPRQRSHTRAPRTPRRGRARVRRRHRLKRPRRPLAPGGRRREEEADRTVRRQKARGKRQRAKVEDGGPRGSRLSPLPFASCLLPFAFLYFVTVISRVVVL